LPEIPDFSSGRQSGNGGSSGAQGSQAGSQGSQGGSQGSQTAGSGSTGDGGTFDVTVNPGIPGMPGMPGTIGFPVGGLPGGDSGSGTSTGSGGDTMPGTPGIAGTGAGTIGSEDFGFPGGRSGAGSSGGMQPLPSIGGSSTQRGSGDGPLTRDEQLAVLDGALGRGYEEFDGFILAERARVQRESDELGADPSGLYEDGGDGSGDGTFGLAGVISSGAIEGGAGSGGRPEVPGGEGSQSGGSGGSVGGPQGGEPSGEEGAYPIPDDIPSGRDDDVVARQIREAAMREPDPELRERLWDEYRRYTGID